MIIKFFGANEFLPQNKILQFLAKYGCELTEAERYICENTVFVLCGFDKAQYNEVCLLSRVRISLQFCMTLTCLILISQTLMPVIFGHTPAGTSTKTVVHYAQEIHESMYWVMDSKKIKIYRIVGRTDCIIDQKPFL